jgi:hypothetical protein
MKYTIQGFSQEKMLVLGMDPTDALLLRWFVDFKDSGRMETQILHEKIYYWIKYSQIMEDLPCLGIEKRAIQRRLKKMTKNERKVYWILSGEGEIGTWKSVVATEIGLKRILTRERCGGDRWAHAHVCYDNDSFFGGFLMRDLQTGELREVGRKTRASFKEN